MIPDFHTGVAVLTLFGSAHLSAQRMHHELQPVTDAEHRQSKLEHSGIGRRSIGVVHRARTAREDDANRRVAADFLKAGGAWQYH